MTTPVPAGYYNRFDPSKNYEEHQFRAGYVLQSAELNELQKNGAFRLKSVADVLFRDGNIIRDAQIVVNPTTGATECEAGAIYLRGMVRGVPSATITIPVVGTVAVGIWLVETSVTDATDPTLRDPATGLRNYNEPGATRLKVQPAWGWDGDGGSGDFFPVYMVDDGVLRPKDAPPTIDAVSIALAKYDRDSAGGMYVVQGLDVSADADASGMQVYIIKQGRARVYGWPVDFVAARRATFDPQPYARIITAEPHVAAGGTETVTLNHHPVATVGTVTLTAEVTETVTHGGYLGVTDPLAHSSVLSIVEVKQGGTTYVATTDYVRDGDSISWVPAGAEPATGSTYTVKYRYIASVTPASHNSTGITIAAGVTAVVGTTINVTYSYHVPRVDRLCLSQDGTFVFLKGVSADVNPWPPTVPPDLLPLAIIYQTWDGNRIVTPDGPRMVPMADLFAVQSKLDRLLMLQALTDLKVDASLRDTALKKSIFADPLIDDTMRDVGQVQTAAIVDNVLMLPLTATADPLDADIIHPATLPATLVTAVEQPLRTGSMQINPYMAFGKPAASLLLKPAFDHFTVGAPLSPDVPYTNPSHETKRVTAMHKWVATATRHVEPQFVRFTKPLPPTRSSHPPGSSVVDQRSRVDAEFMRSIPVDFEIAGFDALEGLTSMTFDGVPVTVNSLVTFPRVGRGSPMPLTADANGRLIGNFTIPANIRAGTKLVVATGANGSTARATFTGDGQIIEHVETGEIVDPWLFTNEPPRDDEQYVDPLAQTFSVPTATQVGAVDVYIAAKGATDIIVQIRTTSVGMPTGTIIAASRLKPAAITVGAFNSFAFAAPPLLNADQDYAIVVLCNDPVGAVGIAELGKQDIPTGAWVTSQPYQIGVLLSSSNAVTWTAHQDRDLTFSLQRNRYTATTRTIPLGKVPVTAATDLMVQALMILPSDECSIDFAVTLPDASVLTVSNEQAMQLAATITGDVNVSALLSGTADLSPVLLPDTMFAHGALQATGTYITRAMTAGNPARIRVIIDAIIPSGSSVAVQYSGTDIGDTYATVTALSNSPLDNGWREYQYEVSGVNEAQARTMLTLNGTPAARPYVANVRMMVM